MSARIFPWIQGGQHLVREYLGKPGRNSSEQEKAKRQAFLDAVQTEQGGVTPAEDMVLKTTTQEESPPMFVEPLESPRHLTWLLLRDPKSLNAQERQMLAFICQVRDIQTTYDLAQRFFTLVKQRQAEQFDTWLEECLISTIPDLRTFAEGLKREYSAMKGAPTFSYSHGLVERQINKMKYIKRSMYGYGSFALLRQLVLQAA